MLGNDLAKRWRYIDATKVYVPAADGVHTPTSGVPSHLNATLPPNNVNAPTEFTYEVTDGSDDAPYLKA